VRWWLVGAALVAVTGTGLWRWSGTARDDDALPVPGSVVLIEVEVLNATSIDGLARRVTRLLRRHGIDVVYYGSAEPGSVDSTTFVIRRGDSTVARPLLDVLGIGRVISEPSNRRLLDVTILLGPDAAHLGRDP
jgi:hypothetical protein